MISSVGLRGRLKRLEREAREGAVLIHQRDGSVRGLDRMHVMAQMYLARYDAALGLPPRSSDSDVLEALENATPESRRHVEEMSRSSFVPDDLEPSTSAVEDLSEQG